MYYNAISNLFAAAVFQRSRDRNGRRRGPRETPRGLGEFNDHYLRDIGFEREGRTRQHALLMRM